LETTGSPDGTKIAFVSNRDEESGGWSELYVMNADGSNQTRLTYSSSAFELDPAWSPDGTKIAFTSIQENGAWVIYTINPDGSNQTRLTSTETTSGHPAWSPDGAKIAFFSYQDGPDSGIYVMNADGSNQTRLTNGSMSGDGWPAWSPDGTKIAFATGRDGNWEIYVMNVDGTNQTNLTNHPSPDIAPDWQPLPGPKAPTSKDQCKNGGYEAFEFKNQGQCIASVPRAAKSQ
jgi:Tol biopolymer transport system component